MYIYIYIYMYRYDICILIYIYIYIYIFIYIYYSYMRYLIMIHEYHLRFMKCCNINNKRYVKILHQHGHENFLPLDREKRRKAGKYAASPSTPSL